MDNAGRTYFEGIKEIEDWGGGVITQSFTVAMKAGQIYKVIAEFNDSGGLAGAYIKFFKSNINIYSINIKYLYIDIIKNLQN